MKIARVLMLLVLAGCSLFRPEPNVEFTVEPGSAQDDPQAVAQVLQKRVEAFGGRVDNVDVAGRTVHMVAYLEDHGQVLPMLLASHKVEFAMADDAGLDKVADEIVADNTGFARG
jgi:hypothetical protein